MFIHFLVSLAGGLYLRVDLAPGLTAGNLVPGYTFLLVGPFKVDFERVDVGGFLACDYLLNRFLVLLVFLSPGYIVEN